MESVEPEAWFRFPAGGVTHVAWQVGHIAVAEHYLTMLRIRGQRPEDGQLVPRTFSKCFGKGSVPTETASDYPSVEEIRSVFDAVHRRALDELAALPDESLDQKVDPPHPAFSTKLGALQFCPMHEMIHAGQIGLIRRLLGAEPLR
jgi:uncharacterized damage-inducible protein DinB